MLISIIIPFYDNDVNNIPNIIQELKKLSFSKEVIFVDDRNDKSVNIDLPSEYKIIKSSQFINNVGTFEARRSGTLEAIGDYIWFIDIDDKLNDITRLPTNEDVVAYEYSLLFNDNKLIDSYMLKYLNCTKMELKSTHNIKAILKYSGLGLWNKLFKREILLKTFNKIPFLNKFTKNEDGYTYFEILKNSNIVGFKFEHIYIYCNPNKHESKMKELKLVNKLDEYLENEFPKNCPDRSYYMDFLKGVIL